MTDHSPPPPRRRPGNEVRHDTCRCGHWRSSHQGLRGCLNCECGGFALQHKDGEEGTGDG